MFLRLLKWIFPQRLLSRAYYYYKALKVKTFDRIVYREFKLDSSYFLTYRTGYPYRENNIETTGIENLRVKKYLDKWFDWTQEEFILQLDQPCWIEPDYGWALVGRNSLIYYSLGISRTWFQKKPKLIKYWFRKSKVHLDFAISLRDSGEENYFHFYNDVLAKLFQLFKSGVDIYAIPVVVSTRLYSKRYFQDYLELVPRMKSIQWVIQEDQYIRCGKSLFCKPMTHRPDLLEAISAPLTILRKPERRVFLTRGSNTSRYLLNTKEILELLESKGFEIIDTAGMSLSEQRNCFSNIKHLVGIHGAGLTNILFLNSGSTVLEIFESPAEDYLPFHYHMLSSMKGLEYQAIIGESKSDSFAQGFVLDAKLLSDCLDKMHSNSHSG